MGNTASTLSDNIALNENAARQAHKLVDAAESYYDQNKESCNKIINNAHHLAQTGAPVTEEQVDYTLAPFRRQRLIDDMDMLISCDNDENWQIVSGGVADLLSDQPSKFELSLKHGYKLNINVDSDYPLKPPKCKLNKHLNHPCVDDQNNIILFENVWSASFTLQDVAHFCSIIVQGEDPTYVIYNHLIYFADYILL